MQQFRTKITAVSIEFLHKNVSFRNITLIWQLCFVLRLSGRIFVAGNEEVKLFHLKLNEISHSWSTSPTRPWKCLSFPLLQSRGVLKAEHSPSAPERHPD